MRIMIKQKIFGNIYGTSQSKYNIIIGLLLEYPLLGFAHNYYSFH